MENKSIKPKRHKVVNIFTVIVLAIATILAIGYIERALFFSTPETTIRNFYGAISNNQLENCISYTDIEDTLNAQVKDQTQRDQVMQTFLKQFNINERTIHIKLLQIQRVSGNDQTAVYNVKYDTDITYKNGSTYTGTESDTLTLTNIRGKWKITNGNAMYKALSQIMTSVIEGQNDVLGGIK
ncbi:hypothetical protein [uncultured Clostridium sp.]|uniref:hypothetical protein n=1 Tax=uncultured Clostridium sp. TaxID=59620 RepID=UPI00262646CB|nr:hypothetical protein [uncultured Clostridium sp.]